MAMIQRNGNDQVIAVLEQTLAEARQGEMGFIGLVCGKRPPRDDELATFKGTFRGDTSLEEGAIEALGTLKQNISDAYEICSIPTESTMPRNYVVYDAVRGAMGYDFCNWFVEQEMERIAAGAPSPLKVAFFHGKDGKWGYEQRGRRQMLENVIKPMLPLLGAVQDDAAINGHTKKFYLAKGVVEKCRVGQPVPRFKAPHAKRVEVYKWLGKRKRPMVITLRESTGWPERNSNLEAWVRFGWWLEDQGHDVIFVRDTQKAFDPKPDRFNDCPQASIDVQFRMALYESAACTFFTSNGPHMLTVYSDCPYLVFIRTNPDGHEYEADTPRFWRDKFGVEAGSQFPWARDDQRIIWAPDTFENIMYSYNELPLERRAA